MAVALLRKTKIRELTGMSDSNIYRLEQLGLFPKRRRLNPSGRSVGWLSDEIEAWLRSREQVTQTNTAQQIGSGKSGPGRGHKKTA